jgi:excisionase family DNA binding protein
MQTSCRRHSTRPRASRTSQIGAGWRHYLGGRSQVLEPGRDAWSSNPTKSATPERLWSTAQLAEYLGVPVKTIHQWRYMQKGPRGFRVGRHIRFRPADVRVWEDEQLEASA